MRIATWNVNSVRTRLDQVRAWLQRENPEVLCLQETKVADELFPVEAFRSLGYEAVIRRDYPVVLGSLYFFTLIGLVVKLVSDLLYRVVDPRVQFGSVAK